MAKKVETKPSNIRASGNRSKFSIATVVLQLLLSILIAGVLHIADVNLLRDTSNNLEKAKAHIVPRTKAHLLTPEERVREGEKYFHAATTFSGSSGQGRAGWLFLLAAYDYDRTNAHYLRNLVDNYVASGFADLAIDELQNVLREYPDTHAAIDLLHEIRDEHPEVWKVYQERLGEKLGSKFLGKLKPPKLHLPFATIVAQYFIAEQFPDMLSLNQDFYDATMVAYNQVKKEWRAKDPSISETELNHKFFQWQMGILKNTGSYWDGYARLPLFSNLILLMREAAANFLMNHGMDPEAAIRKASHNIIFWASVHTGNSVHEPHMTEDALIGGVYYVSVPEHSGDLGIFDPRGRSPMLDPLVKGITSPPFHRTQTLTPVEGVMVLFPGWLVHTVLPSEGLDVNTSKYRISISVNLKGEWQDTAGLFLNNVDIDTPDVRSHLEAEERLKRDL